MDDLIGDEATEAADQEQVQAAIAAANIKARNEDINPEELERYIKERFEAPREFAAGSDFNEQSGGFLAESLPQGLENEALDLHEKRHTANVEALAEKLGPRTAAMLYMQLTSCSNLHGSPEERRGGIDLLTEHLALQQGPHCRISVQ